MLEYLNSYAEVFKLRPHIQFRTKVLMCLPAPHAGCPRGVPGPKNNPVVCLPENDPVATARGSDKTRGSDKRADGRWEVELANGEKRIYKGVIVCNGHHWDK